MATLDQEALQYDIDALRDNVQRCKANIRTFKEAIAKERATIKQLKYMIGVLEEKAAADGSQG